MTNCAGTGGGSGSEDSCPYANNGVCDEPSLCELGTDTSDCSGDGSDISPPLSNDDSCFYANDGYCDEPLFCEKGTDGSDCSKCTDYTVGGSAWTDSDGDSCASYAVNAQWCLAAASYSNLGYDASEICCTCGGGQTPDIGEDNGETHTHTSNSTLSSCTDYTLCQTSPGFVEYNPHCNVDQIVTWADSNFISCASYNDNTHWCSEASSYTNQGYDASEMCCACGGGNRSNSTGPTSSFGYDAGGDDASDGDRVCHDDVTFDAGYGGCSTYGEGGANEGFCYIDRACDTCTCSCAYECSSDDSLNNAPFFTVLRGVVQVFSTASELKFEDQVLLNISKGTPDEDVSQQINFVIVNVTHKDMFLQLPSLNPDGKLSFVLAPWANGSSTLRFFAVDDGGLENGGEDTSETHELTIKSVKSPCSSSAEVPLSVSGKVACVPSHLAPSSSIQHCSVPTWRHVRSHLRSGDYMTGFVSD